MVEQTKSQSTLPNFPTRWTSLYKCAQLFILVIKSQFRTLASLSYDDAQCIVRVCKNLKKLVLSCDFYGRAIRLIVSSLSHCLEVLWLEGRNYNGK